MIPKRTKFNFKKEKFHTAYSPYAINELNLALTPVNIGTTLDPFFLS
jgi:hypothetical protein